MENKIIEGLNNKISENSLKIELLKKNILEEMLITYDNFGVDFYSKFRIIIYNKQRKIRFYVDKNVDNFTVRVNFYKSTFFGKEKFVDHIDIYISKMDYNFSNIYEKLLDILDYFYIQVKFDEILNEKTNLEKLYKKMK